VQLRYERARASELIHLLRLVLLVTALWLNNGTADSCVPSIMSLSERVFMDVVVFSVLRGLPHLRRGPLQLDRERHRRTGTTSALRDPGRIARLVRSSDTVCLPTLSLPLGLVDLLQLLDRIQL
jgi:hypothetical protein